MIRSLGFGSDVTNFYILLAPTCIVKLASNINLLAHYAKGTLSPKLQLLKLAQSLKLIYEALNSKNNFTVIICIINKQTHSLTVLYATDY